MNARISTLLATIASVAATAAIGGLATGPAVQSSWYGQLRKPAYQPPRQVFPVVWPALYADIAVVSASTIDQLNDTGDERKRRAYIAALSANLVLNASWSWVFFNQRRYGSSTALNVVLTASSADLARRAIDVRGKRAVSLVLYPLWCAFATVLSGHISLLNRRRRP
jgi:tryptophan-rich sensory protein